MPTVTLNRKTFEGLLGKKIPEDQLKDRIAMIGTDIGAVTKDTITVEVFPNRPDMLCEQGFARALSAFIGVKPGLREYPLKKSGKQVTITKDVLTVRPRIACALVKGLTFDDERIREVMQLQEKLHTTYGRHRKKCAIGVYPLDAIQFPVTYTAKKPSEITFRPLEANASMTADAILEKHTAGKTYAPLLKGMKLYPVLLDAKNNVLSLPPIINSHETGRVTEKTKDVFVECTGHDQVIVSTCLSMIVTALADMGGSIESVELIYPQEKVVTPHLAPRAVKADLNYINQRLGLELTDKEFKTLFERMGYGYAKGEVSIPSWRADYMHQIDFVEEIAIAYGYENFPVSLPNVSTVGREAPVEILNRKITEILLGLGMQEVNTYHLANEHTQHTKMNATVPLVKLANALNQDYTTVRAWMLPCLLDVLSRNTSNLYPQSIFDCGVVFKKSNATETGVLETVSLAGVLADENADYTKSRQYVEHLLKTLGFAPVFAETEHPSFIAGRVAVVMIDGKQVATVGEVHPLVLTNFGVQMPTCGFEVDVSTVFKLLQKVAK